MQNVTTWRDDHLPCVGFEHNNVAFEVMWTDPALLGRLQLIEEGAITVEQALKSFPGLLAIINNPFNATFASTDEGEREDEALWDVGNEAQYQTEIGYVTTKKVS